MQYRNARTGLRDIDAAFAFMAGVLMLGVILGTLSYCFMSDGTVELLGAATRDHISFRKTADFAHLLLDSFFVSTLFVTAEFLLGFSALGQLPELAVLLYRGSGLGLILSQAYVSTPRGRLPFVILLIVPAAVISCYALCIAAREAVKMSGRLLRVMLIDRQCLGLSEHFRSYAARFAALEAAVAVSAAVDCITSLLIAAEI